MVTEEEEEEEKEKKKKKKKQKTTTTTIIIIIIHTSLSRHKVVTLEAMNQSITQSINQSINQSSNRVFASRLQLTVYKGNRPYLPYMIQNSLKLPVLACFVLICALCSVTNVIVMMPNGLHHPCFRPLFIFLCLMFSPANVILIRHAE